LTQLFQSDKVGVAHGNKYSQHYENKNISPYCAQLAERIRVDGADVHQRLFPQRRRLH